MACLLRIMMTLLLLSIAAFLAAAALRLRMMIHLRFLAIAALRMAIALRLAAMAALRAAIVLLLRAIAARRRARIIALLRRAIIILL